MVYGSTSFGLVTLLEGNSPAMGGEGMGRLCGQRRPHSAPWLSGWGMNGVSVWKMVHDHHAAFHGGTSCSGEEKVKLTPPKLP